VKMTANPYLVSGHNSDLDAIGEVVKTKKNEAYKILIQRMYQVLQTTLCIRYIVANISSPSPVFRFSILKTVLRINSIKKLVF
jgi:hypothetical protein